MGVEAARAQLSTDGNWWWNGKNWLPAKSADGQWQWDGSKWGRREGVEETKVGGNGAVAENAPVHKSADGRWWWDGQQWKPVEASKTEVKEKKGALKTLETIDPVSALTPIKHRRHAYRWVLGIGLLALIALSVVAASTGNAAALSSLVLVGSFFVPLVYVLYMNGLDAFGGIPWSMLLKIGGATALFALPTAYLLEMLTGAKTGALIPAMMVGGIEEGVKIVILVWFVRRCKFRFELDGVIFGAMAGMSFAAFENILYAVNFGSAGTSTLLITFWLRQILGPFGHGTWTAAIAAVIWRERFNGPGKLDRKVLYAYLLSSFLHGLWDWVPVPGLGVIWMLAVGVVSVLVLRRRVKEAKAQERGAMSPPSNQVALART